MFAHPYFCNLFPVTKFIRTNAADRGDLPLYFDKSVYEVEVDESADINQTIFTITAKHHADCK